MEAKAIQATAPNAVRVAEESRRCVLLPRSTVPSGRPTKESDVNSPSSATIAETGNVGMLALVDPLVRLSSEIPAAGRSLWKTLSSLVRFRGDGTADLGDDEPFPSATIAETGNGIALVEPLVQLSSEIPAAEDSLRIVEGRVEFGRRWIDDGGTFSIGSFDGMKNSISVPNTRCISSLTLSHHAAIAEDDGLKKAKEQNRVKFSDQLVQSVHMVARDKAHVSARAFEGSRTALRIMLAVNKQANGLFARQYGMLLGQYCYQAATEQQDPDLPDCHDMWMDSLPEHEEWEEWAKRELEINREIKPLIKPLKQEIKRLEEQVKSLHQKQKEEESQQPSEAPVNQDLINEIHRYWIRRLNNEIRQMSRQMRCPNNEVLNMRLNERFRGDRTADRDDDEPFPSTDEIIEATPVSPAIIEAAPPVTLEEQVLEVSQGHVATVGEATVVTVQQEEIIEAAPVFIEAAPEEQVRPLRRSARIAKMTEHLGSVSVSFHQGGKLGTVTVNGHRRSARLLKISY